jgi:hypothetical protein
VDTADGIRPCRKRPYAPQEHNKLCRIHGGTANSMAGKGAQRRAVRQEMIEMLGEQLDVTPTEAMLMSVREAAGNVAYLRSLVQQLSSEVDDHGRAPVVIDDDGVARVEQAWVGAGLATRTSPTDWKANPHVLVSMYNEERDRLVRFAKLCRDSGVEEAKLAWEMQQGEWLVRTLDTVLEKLGLTPEQQDALPGIMGVVISELEQPASVIDVNSEEQS